MRGGGGLKAAVGFTVIYFKYVMFTVLKLGFDLLFRMIPLICKWSTNLSYAE